MQPDDKIGLVVDRGRPAFLTHKTRGMIAFLYFFVGQLFLPSSDYDLSNWALFTSEEKLAILIFMGCMIQLGLSVTRFTFWSSYRYGTGWLATSIIRPDKSRILDWLSILWLRGCGIRNDGTLVP